MKTSGDSLGSGHSWFWRAALALAAWLVCFPGLGQVRAAEINLPGISALLENSNDPRDVVVRFSGPVDEKSFAGVAENLRDLIEFISVGYDQLLVRGRVPLLARLQDGKLHISAAPADSSLPQDRAAQDFLLRRELLLARMEVSRGAQPAARKRLQRLQAEIGDTPELLAALGEAEAARGAWRPASEMFRRASSLDQANEYFSEAARSAALQGAPFTRLDADVVNVKDGERQSIAVLQSQVPLSRADDIGLIAETRRLQTGNAPDLRNAPHAVDAQYQRYELYVAHQFADAGRARAALLHSSDGTVGGSMGYSQRAQGQESAVSLTYHQPYWELVSGIVNQGSLDRLEGRHEQEFGNGWSGAMTVRYSRYGVADDDDVSRTAGMVAALRKSFEIDTRNLIFGYTIDGEYLHRESFFPDTQGAAFRPLAIGTKEIHSLDATLSQLVSDILRLDLYAGYGIDRYNDKGPYTGLNLVMTGDSNVEFGLRASHARALSRGQQNDVNRAGAYGLVRF